MPSVELEHLVIMLEFSEMPVEQYGHMIRINIVKDNNRFFLPCLEFGPSGLSAHPTFGPEKDSLANTGHTLWFPEND